MSHRCLYCYQPLTAIELATPAGASHYHSKCSQRFFGQVIPPKLDYTQGDILRLAQQVVQNQKTVTGVQPKLSLSLSVPSESPPRFTIVGLWGSYILKPQADSYPHLPENEGLTMRLAAASRIDTVEQALIRLQSSEIAYLTKRIDRQNGSKLHMEDMCQLAGRLTEHKYKGSYEQIAKLIKRYSGNPGLDAYNFYEVVLFSFLTGNSDMHLKNFSLIKRTDHYALSPAYDLVATQLVTDDDEDLALTLNGKKKKITHRDFHAAMSRAAIPSKAIQNLFKKYQKLTPSWEAIIDQSFLPPPLQVTYKALVQSKIKQLLS